jgi:hypothetical protein
MPTIVLPGESVGCTRAWQISIPFFAPHSGSSVAVVRVQILDNRGRAEHVAG